MMRALSLWQPWATLVALGEKRIETRGRDLSYRGEFAIHAARRFDVAQRALLEREPFKSALAYHGITAGNQTHTNLPRGAVVAVVTMIDSVPVERLLDEVGEIRRAPDHRHGRFESSFGDYSAGRFGYRLMNIRRLQKSIMVRGRQGLFTLDPEDERKVRNEVEYAAEM